MFPTCIINVNCCKNTDLQNNKKLTFACLWMLKNDGLLKKFWTIESAELQMRFNITATVFPLINVWNFREEGRLIGANGGEPEALRNEGAGENHVTFFDFYISQTDTLRYLKTLKMEYFETFFMLNYSISNQKRFFRENLSLLLIFYPIRTWQTGFWEKFTWCHIHINPLS